MLHKTMAGGKSHQDRVPDGCSSEHNNHAVRGNEDSGTAEQADGKNHQVGQPAVTLQGKAEDVPEPEEQEGNGSREGDHTQQQQPLLDPLQPYTGGLAAFSSQSPPLPRT
ncbi:MAG: hypothetical protein D4R38_00985 [Dehalococcoidia bacterium]|nr:MAG: hypothetical protein D4R38_00985 [Dehalococcoidia bacterium]